VLRLDAALAGIRRWDERGCARMNRASRYPVVLVLFRVASRLGDGVFWYALMLGLLLRDPRGAALPVLHMLASGLLCTMLYKALKGTTSRPRPYQVHAHIAAGAKPLDRFSFPSGHTLHAVAFTLVALEHFPGLAPLLVPVTLLIAASRVVLGLHYPSDVLGGAALGVLIAALSVAVL
jgi:undecaprenyl-diphosphatase